MVCRSNFHFSLDNIRAVIYVYGFNMPTQITLMVFSQLGLFGLLVFYAINKEECNMIGQDFLLGLNLEGNVPIAVVMRIQ